MIDVCLLGTGGTMPLPDRALTALIMRINGSCILIDCGEGTQVQLRKSGMSMHDIDVILITHFHADHIIGLPGLLLSMAKAERTSPVRVIAPKGAAYVIKSLCVTAPIMPFEIIITEIQNSYEEFNINDLTIKSQLAEHSALCYAYSIELARKGRFIPERARELGIDVRLWSVLQRGETVTSNGCTYSPEMVMGTPRRGLKLTYITDTRPTEQLAALAKNSDLLICEGMYADEDKLQMAQEKKHMLFREAARLAQKADAAQLWLTHFSPSLSDPYEYRDYITNLFENTLIPHDLESTTLKFSD